MVENKKICIGCKQHNKIDEHSFVCSELAPGSGDVLGYEDYLDGEPCMGCWSCQHSMDVDGEHHYCHVLGKQIHYTNDLVCEYLDGGHRWEISDGIAGREIMVKVYRGNYNDNRVINDHCPRCEWNPEDAPDGDDPEWILGKMWHPECERGMGAYYQIFHCLNCGLVYATHLN